MAAAMTLRCVAALLWFRRAAGRGNPGAQYDLGRIYDEGNGVPQDYVSAHMWWNLASGNGSATGPAARDAVAANMTAADISEAQRWAWVRLASEYQDCE
jgi:TPR repeat protein